MTAYQVLHRTAKAKRGETVLVHGAAGRVGVAALELGALAGLRLYGTASARDRAKVEALGAVAIDYRNEDFLARVREEAGGVDVVVDSLGGPISLRSFRALRPRRKARRVRPLRHAQGRAQGLAGGDQVVRGDRGRLALGQAIAPPAGVRLPRSRSSATRQQGDAGAVGGEPATRSGSARTSAR